jgi:hypothetical protein
LRISHPQQVAAYSHHKGYEKNTDKKCEWFEQLQRVNWLLLGAARLMGQLSITAHKNMIAQAEQAPYRLAT